MRDPVIADVRRDHPLARQLDLTDVNIAAARRLALAPGDVAVAGSFGVPLLIARERPGLRIAATSFDPRRSDLPMRPAFPLLIANALAWAPGANADAAIEAPPALLTGASARPRDDLPEIAIAHVGFHRAGDMVFAANLGDARESDTTPAAELALGGRKLAPPDPPAWRGGVRAGRARALARVRAAGRRVGQLPPPVDDVSALFGDGNAGVRAPAWLLAAARRRRCVWLMARAIARRLSRRPAARCRRCCGRWCWRASPWRWRVRRCAARRARSRRWRSSTSPTASPTARSRSRRDAVAGLARAAAERGDPPPRVVRFAARAEEVAAVDPQAPAIARLPPPAGAATDLALAVGFGAGPGRRHGDPAPPADLATASRRAAISSRPPSACAIAARRSTR